jgi:DNA topoisomerase-3
MVIEVKCESEVFRATGKQPTVAGWKEIFGNVIDEDGAEPLQVLPAMSAGDALTCMDAKVAGKATKPPARLTDGTLAAWIG